MSNFSRLVFTETTAEDQENYFCGDFKIIRNQFGGGHPWLNPGEYRIVDGELCKIISDLPEEDFRKKFETIKHDK